MGQPRPLFYLISSFQTHYKFYNKYLCEKCPSSIQCWDSNSQPAEHESPPITTRLGLLPMSWYELSIKTMKDESIQRCWPLSTKGGVVYKSSFGALKFGAPSIYQNEFNIKNQNILRKSRHRNWKYFKAFLRDVSSENWALNYVKKFVVFYKDNCNLMAVLWLNLRRSGFETQSTFFWWKSL